MEKLYKLISDTQASLFLLFQKTWVYHWHVVGSDFKQIHDLFGEQYEALQEEVDRISEHMRFLGIKPISSLSRVVEVSGVGEATITARSATTPPPPAATSRWWPRTPTPACSSSAARWPP